jgi:GT2 family glycosyltransferase
MGEAARAAMQGQDRTALGATLEAAIATAWPRQTVEIAFDDRPRMVELLGRAFPPPRPARTAIVILNYGHPEDTARLIGTLQAGTETDFDLYVVDNATPNLSAFDLATRFACAHVLRLPENLGYAAGNNAALRLIAGLGYDFVWILNPDMVVPPEALAQHIDAARAHPGTAIFGPALLRGGPAPRLASAGCFVSLTDGLSTGHLYAGELPEALPAEPYVADFVTGAAVFLRASVLPLIGTIPEEYFLYFEETAWLTAARDMGFGALVLPHIRLAHHKRSEDGDLPAPYFYYYYIRNALIFAGRRGGPEAVAATAARLQTDFIAAWTARIAKAEPDQSGHNRPAFYDRLAQTALADGLAGRTGPVDLIAIKLASAGLASDEGPNDGPAAALPDPKAACTAIVTPEGRLLGRLDLDPATATRPCTVTALLDGRLAGHVRAVPAEPDPGPAAPRLHSFEIDLPASARSGTSHRIDLYVNGRPARTGAAALDRFLARPAPAPEGGFGGLAGHVCRGWLVDQSDPDAPLMAEIRHEGRVIGRGLADRPRDGAATGGFAIRLPRAFADGAAHLLHLHRAGQSGAKTRPLATARLADAQFTDPRTASARAQPAPAVLSTLAYGQTLWFGAQDPASLPIGRYLRAAAGTARLWAAGQTNTPLVSVILPVRGRSAAALRALRSVQAQTYPLWEAILVDDASTDDTADRLADHLADHLARAADSRISLIRRDTHGGAAAARNSGLARAYGEVIAWLDSDDHWDPAYLSVMTAALMQPSQAGRAAPEAVYCGTWLAQDSPEPPEAPMPEAPAQEVIGLRLPPPSLALIENDDVIALSSLVHRRSLTDRLGGFDADLARYAGWDLVLRASAEALPQPVQAALVTRTLGPDSLTETEPDGPALAQIAARIARRGTGATAASAAALARPVDVVLRVPQGAEAPALRRRIEAIWLTLQPGAGQRLIVQTSPAMIAALAEHKLPDPKRPDLLLRPIDAGPDSALWLRDALACRRASADLALLEPSALVQSGWLAALGRARSLVPGAGMLVPRHVLPGRTRAARRHAPATRPERDVCITVSVQLRNLIEPQPDRLSNLRADLRADIRAEMSLDPVEGLIALSAVDPFCTYLPAGVADLLSVPDTGTETGQDGATDTETGAGANPDPDSNPDPNPDPGPHSGADPDHATVLRDWADVIRLHLRRPLIYCPRALAFEMPL